MGIVRLMKNSGPDSDLEIFLRRWPHLPEHVRKTLIELVLHYGPPTEAVCFPTPIGADWPDVEIILLSPKQAKITVGSMVKQYTFSGIGLADKRRPDRPRTEWRMLRTYAENPEPDAYYRLPYREGLKVDISKFRRWLQGFFGIPGDPLKPFKSALWLPRFKVRADY